MGNHHYLHAIQPEPFKSTHPQYDKTIVISEGSIKRLQGNVKCQQNEFKEWKQRVLPFTVKEDLPIAEYLYLPVQSSFQFDRGCCTNTGQAIIIYPYFETLLSEEIDRRSPKQELFKESELWYLLYALTAAKFNLTKFGEKLGDTKPLNVFITHERKIKVGSILTSPKQKSSYYKLLNKQSETFNFLLAPEDIEEAKMEVIDNKGNYKSEVFSIGATVLSAALLDNLQDLYDYKNLAFSEEIFKKKINQWMLHQKYSEIFRSVILNLVYKPILKRIQIDTLWKFLSHYSTSIVSKEPFIVSNPPNCFQSGVLLIRSNKI